MICLNNQLTKYEVICLQKIIKISLEGDIIQFGKLFSTKKNKYFYDAGTGKVICIDDEMYLIIYLIFAYEIKDIDTFIVYNNICIESLKKFLDICITEKLFKEQDTTNFIHQTF